MSGRRIGCGCLLLIGLIASAETSTVGWRGDGSGVYPDATPPLRWSSEAAVVWRQAMPGATASTPLLIGDRLITLADPHWLLAVDTDSGDELWRVALSTDALTAPETLAAVERLAEQRHALWEQKKALEVELAAATGDTGQLQARIDALEAERKALPKMDLKPQHGVGHSCPTPVSDGASIWVLLHSGVVACVSVDGELRWSRMLRPASMGYGQSMSPALAGDILGLHIDDHFFGLDAATGELRWRTDETQHQGSPLAVPLGAGRWCFLGTDGSVFAASDGTRLADFGFPAMNRFGTAVLRGDTAWWIAEGRALVHCRFAWHSGALQLDKGHVTIDQGTFYASPLLVDGRAYLWDNVDYSRKDKHLLVWDLTERRQLLSQPTPVGGWAYTSPTAAGAFVFVQGSNGDTVVYRPGQERVAIGPDRFRQQFVLKEVARNAIGEKIWAHPIFRGRDMYLRSFAHLYRIRASDADLALAERLAGQLDGAADDAPATDEDEGGLLDELEAVDLGGL